MKNWLKSIFTPTFLHQKLCNKQRKKTFIKKSLREDLKSHLFTVDSSINKKEAESVRKKTIVWENNRA